MEYFKDCTRRRHKCSVPGCRNRETMRFARSEGATSVLFLCDGCIAGAFAAARGLDLKGNTTLAAVEGALCAPKQKRTPKKKGEDNGKH